MLMEDAKPSDGVSGPWRERWVFDFALDGDLRFISHRDTLRLFHRALARASLPVSFSEGFNPHPRVTLPLPRPVGVASEAEALTVEFEQEIDCDQALAELARHVPKDIRLTGLRKMEPGERTCPIMVRYRLDVSDLPCVEVEARIRAILAESMIEITRVSRKDGKTRKLDARSHIVDMRFIDDTVEFVLRINDGGGVRPGEIAALLGFDSGGVNHKIRRMEIQWEKEPSKKTANP